MSIAPELHLLVSNRELRLRTRVTEDVATQNGEDASWKGNPNEMMLKLPVERRYLR